MKGSYTFCGAIETSHQYVQSPLLLVRPQPERTGPRYQSGRQGSSCTLSPLIRCGGCQGAPSTSAPTSNDESRRCGTSSPSQMLRPKDRRPVVLRPPPPAGRQGPAFDAKSRTMTWKRDIEKIDLARFCFNLVQSLSGIIERGFADLRKHPWLSCLRVPSTSPTPSHTQ